MSLCRSLPYIAVHLVVVQPWPNELYEITYPDGKTRRGKLNAKGQAHIGLAEPMDVSVTFPHLDQDAWERSE